MGYEKSVRKLLEVYGNDPVHVTPKVLTDIYEKIFGCLPDGCSKNPVCQLDDENNMKNILLTLQDDILRVDLSHIDSTKVAHGDPVSVEYLLEILAGYVEYILEANPQNVSQILSDTSDNDEAQHPINRTFTPTKREILVESPIKSILSSEQSEIPIDPGVQNTSAFLTGYRQGLASSIDETSINPENDGSLLQRLNKLPHLSEALKKNGLDVSDYTITSSQMSKVNDTDDLLAGSESDIGDCVAQSTPFPDKKEAQYSPVSTQTAREEPPRTPDHSIDENIKNRLLYLLEQSGNTKSRTRQVRFDLPDSPVEDVECPNYQMKKEKFEAEIEKRILEEELKEKIDQLVLEKKKLRDLTIKKTTPRPQKKKKIPQSKGRNTPSKSPTKVPTVTEDLVIKDYLLPQMLEEFPYLHVSPQTARVLWNKQVKQINALTQADSNKTKLIKKHLEEEEKRQELLLGLMKKELDFVTRTSNKKAVLEEKRILKAKLLEKKLTSARVRKYHQDYCKRTKARMCNKNYKEEIMFKELFEQGLKIQKEKLLEARKRAKVENEEAKQKHQKDIKELENYYTDQFDLMSRDMEQAQKEKEVLQKEKIRKLQNQKIHQRNKMKEEIATVQENLVRSDDHVHFKELDFDRALRKLAH